MRCFLGGPLGSHLTGTVRETCGSWPLEIRIGWRRGVPLITTSIQTLADWVPPHRGTLIEISVSGSDHLQPQAGALSDQRVWCTVLPDSDPQAWGLFLHPAWEANSQSDLLLNITPIPTRLERPTSPTQLLTTSPATSPLGSLTRASEQPQSPSYSHAWQEPSLQYSWTAASQR